MANVSQRPLITFALFAYNQECFIREAVEGAFSQTYSPLEIILSDDCSTDGTFGIMMDMAKAYQGPHKIILNRNEKNLGFAEHINYVASIASGEWYVFAAGDDISLPERTVEHFELIKNKRDTYYSGGGVILIDEKGKAYRNGVFDFNKMILLPGCMAAYHRNCFDLFEKLNPEIESEDYVLPYRSLLLGNMILINSPLVKYRCPTTDFFESYIKTSHFQKNLRYAFSQRKADIKTMSNRYSKNILDVLLYKTNKYLLTLNYSSDYRSKIIDIYEAPLKSRIKLIMHNNNFSLKRRFKLLILSFRIVRIIYGKLKILFHKNSFKPFNNKIITISIDHIISKKVVIQGF